MRVVPPPADTSDAEAVVVPAAADDDAGHVADALAQPGDVPAVSQSARAASAQLHRARVVHAKVRPGAPPSQVSPLRERGVPSPQHVHVRKRQGRVVHDVIAAVEVANVSPHPRRSFPLKSQYRMNALFCACAMSDLRPANACASSCTPSPLDCVNKNCARSASSARTAQRTLQRRRLVHVHRAPHVPGVELVRVPAVDDVRAHGARGALLKDPRQRLVEHVGARARVRRRRTARSTPGLPEAARTRLEPRCFGRVVPRRRRFLPVFPFLLRLPPGWREIFARAASIGETSSRSTAPCIRCVPRRRRASTARMTAGVGGGVERGLRERAPIARGLALGEVDVPVRSGRSRLRMARAARTRVSRVGGLMDG